MVYGCEGIYAYAETKNIFGNDLVQLLFRRGQGCPYRHGKLFEEIRAGKYEAYTSAYVIDVLDITKEEPKRSNMLALIGEYNIKVLDDSNEAQDLVQHVN